MNGTFPPPPDLPPVCHKRGCRDFGIHHDGPHVPVEDTAERCPVCRGVAELTYSGFLTCREHGSEHYRVKAADA